MTQRIIDAYLTIPREGYVSYPLHNIPHVSNSCHFNAVVQMFSTMNLVMDQLVRKIDPLSAYLTLPFVDVVGQSGWKVVTTLLQHAAKQCGVNIYQTEYAPDTARRLLKAIGNPVEVFFWDTTSASDPNDPRNFEDLILQFDPIYLLTNLSDVNAVNNNQSTKVQLGTIVVADRTWKLSSLVVFTPGHYIFIQIHGQQCYIYDDLSYKQPLRQFPLRDITRYGSEHVLGLYVRE